MSWFASAEVFHDTVEGDLENIEVTGQDINLPHVAEAVNTARRAAIDIVRSGAVGFGNARVNLNGHANPDHKPVEGWTNDTITVTVTQI